MTTYQFAFVLLCFAQIVHFSRHWVLLTMSLREDAREARIRTSVDWKAARPRKRR